MDVIESVVRALIKEGKLSRARALLSVFYDEYPHLVFELEEASGNYAAALKAFEKLPDDMKRLYESRKQRIEERLKKDYKQEFRDALVELEKRNYEGAMALLEGITKDYPELVEAVALKLEIARRRGERAKIQSLEELLEALDPTHPALVGRVHKKRVSRMGVFEYTVVILSTLVLFLVILTLFSVPGKSYFDERFQDLKSAVAGVKMNVDFSELEGAISSQIADVKRLLSAIATRLPEDVAPKIDELSKKIDELSAKNFSDVRREIEKLKEELKNFPTSEQLDEVLRKLNEIEGKVTSVGVATVTRVPTKEITEKLANLESEISEIKRMVGNLSIPPLLPGEKVYKPSSTLDAAKIYWLAGYIMYLKSDFRKAIELFDRSLEIVEKEFPRVYFHDDCAYYRALSYYMMGDVKTAKELFEDFIKEFDYSEYKDDAQRMLERIGGERG